MWRVVKRTGFGVLGWRAGFLTAKSRIVIDAERDNSSDQLTLMDVCRRDAWRGCLDSFPKANKFVCSKQGELRGEEYASLSCIPTTTTTRLVEEDQRRQRVGFDQAIRESERD